MDLISGMKITIITIIITIITITLLKMYIYFSMFVAFCWTCCPFFPEWLQTLQHYSSVDLLIDSLCALHMFPSFWWWLVNVKGGFVETTWRAGGLKKPVQLPAFSKTRHNFLIYLFIIIYLHIPWYPWSCGASRFWFYFTFNSINNRAGTGDVWNWTPVVGLKLPQ